MNIEQWPTDRPKLYAANARTLSSRAVDTLAASIREFGFRQPIVVDKKGVIVVGHTRLLAAQKLGMTEVPVHVADALTPAQCRAYRLADNRTANETDWDLDKLASEMKELAALDYSLDLTGFDAAQIRELTKPEPLTDADEVPPPPVTPVSRTGDLWLLGAHRVLCGDSTNAADVARLMDGAKAGLMNTDPPYGIAYDSAELHEHGVSYAKIAGDHHEDEALQRFLEDAFRAALTALEPNAAWYLWHAMLTQGFFAAAAAAAAAHVILHRQIIWVKPVLVFGRGQYHWKHELCFMGWVKGNEPPNYTGHTDTTVWEVNGVTQGEREEFQHATPKPVELFRRPILKHLKSGEICYEPFAGSGPQFIAAEMTGRICYGLELSPAHIDVIVTRWQQHTGLRATLAGDGRTFEEIGAERAPHEEEAAPVKEKPATRRIKKARVS